jgi:hypothetical protein
VITSPNGVVYTATLPAGAIKPTAPKSTRYRFRDLNAKKGTGAYNGLALVQIDPHSNGYKVVIQAYGDFSKAAARMTVQFVIGNDEFFNKEVWSPTRRGGWVLHVN